MVSGSLLKKKIYNHYWFFLRLNLVKTNNIKTLVATSSIIHSVIKHILITVASTTYLLH